MNLTNGIMVYGGSNAEDWRRKFEEYAKTNGFFRQLSGEYLAPVKPLRPKALDMPLAKDASMDEVIRMDSSQIQYENSLSNYSTKSNEFLSNRDKALSSLGIALGNDYRQVIENITCPAEAWQKVQSELSQNDAGSRNVLLGRFNNMNLASCTGIANFSSSLKEIVDLLNANSKETAPCHSCKAKVKWKMIGHDLLVSKFLQGLNEEYSNLVLICENDEELMQDYNKVVAKFMAHERNKKDKEIAEAANIMPTYQTKKPIHGKYTGKKCGHCGAIGTHTEYYEEGKEKGKVMCYKLRNDLLEKYAKNGLQKSESAKLLVDTSELEWKLTDTVLDYTNEMAAVSIDMIYNSCFLAGKTDPMFFIDSGATSHMVNDSRLLTHFVQKMMYIKVGDNREIASPGYGRITLKSTIGSHSVVIDRVLLVPELCANLVSVSKFKEQGLSTVFHCDGKVEIRNEKKVCLSGRIQDRLYCLIECEPVWNSQVENTMIASGESCRVSDEVWHKRLGHLSIGDIKKLENISSGMNISITNYSTEQKTCADCQLGKGVKQSLARRTTARSNQPGAGLHSDVCGPFTTQTPEGFRYFVTFTDDYSRYTTVVLIKNKSDVFQAFKNYLAQMENQTERKVKFFVSDNGGEYTSNVFQDLLVERGIIFSPTTPRSPELNGVAERMNRTINDKARTMLIASGLPQSYWGHAVQAATHIKNRCPTRFSGITPFQGYHGTIPNVGHLRVFGCLAFANNNDPAKKKLDPRAHMGINIGYLTSGKGYKIYVPSLKKIASSRSVIFDESKMAYKTQNYIDPFPTITHEIVQSTDLDYNDNLLDAASDSIHLRNRNISSSISPLKENVDKSDTEPNDNSDDEFFETSEPTAPSSRVEPVEDFTSPVEPADDVKDVEAAPTLAPRIRKPTGFYKSGHVQFCEDIQYIPPLTYQIALQLDELSPSREDDPNTVNEALASKNSSEWKDAIADELDSINRNNTYELVKLPKGRKAIGSRIILKTKYDVDGNVAKRKARLVAKGYSQQYGVDYEDTFAPVVKYQSIRAILSIAAVQNWEIDQLDVKTAFLNGILEEEVYMEQPKGFEKPGMEDYVCRLIKSIYGLKQAPRAWYKRFDSHLLSLGFDRLDADHGIYYRNTEEGKTILCLWVDDSLLISSNQTVRDKIKQQLKSEFEMTEINSQCFVGLQWFRNRKEKVIEIHQHAYLETILNRFREFVKTRKYLTPMENSKLPTLEQCPTTNEERREMDNLPYASIVGALLFASRGSRPDIAHAVGIASRFNNNPGRAHFELLCRILSYLSTTKHYTLTFGNTDIPNTVIGYSDSDWGGCPDTSRSTGGYVFVLNGAAISWQSKRLPICSSSSAEAEYITMSDASREAIWLRNLLAGIGYTQLLPTKLYGDNNGALSSAKNPTNHSKMKHIAIRIHCIRDYVENGFIKVERCNTDDMVADSLTKPVPIKKFAYCNEGMGFKVSRVCQLRGSVEYDET